MITIDKRAAILEATLDLVVKHGLHAAPMSKVAAKAGVGAGTIYRYFKNKDALINALYLELKAAIAGAVLKDDNPDDIPRVRFIRFWSNIFRHFIAAPETTLFLEQCALSPIITQETMDQVHVHFAPLINLFTGLIEQGAVKDMPLEILGTLSFETALNLAKRHIAGYITMDDKLIRLAAEACWDAISA